MHKKWFGAVGCLILLLILCAVLYCNRFEPKTFTQAFLDASYKNITEDYISQTGTNQEEADAVFQKNIDAAMEQMTNLKEGMSEEYRSLFEQILKEVRYSLGEVIKDKNGNYMVQVIVEPMLLFENTYDTFQAKAQEYAANISNFVMAGGEMPGEEEMQAELFQIYYDILKENVDSGLVYGEPQTIVLHIYKQKPFTYEISDEDLQMLDDLLISENKLQE